jgi:hypothetical protein
MLVLGESVLSLLITGDEQDEGYFFRLLLWYRDGNFAPMVALPEPTARPERERDETRQDRRHHL